MQCERCGKQINNLDIGFCDDCDSLSSVFQNRDGEICIFYIDGKYGLKFKNSDKIAVNPIFSEIIEDYTYGMRLFRVMIQNQICLVHDYCDNVFAMPQVNILDGTNNCKRLSKTGKILS